jgi:hypothetical protein
MTSFSPNVQSSILIPFQIPDSRFQLTSILRAVYCEVLMTLIMTTECSQPIIRICHIGSM